VNNGVSTHHFNENGGTGAQAKAVNGPLGTFSAGEKVGLHLKAEPVQGGANLTLSVYLKGKWNGFATHFKPGSDTTLSNLGAFLEDYHGNYNEYRAGNIHGAWGKKVGTDTWAPMTHLTCTYSYDNPHVNGNEQCKPVQDGNYQKIYFAAGGNNTSGNVTTMWNDAVSMPPPFNDMSNPLNINQLYDSQKEDSYKRNQRLFMS